MDSTLLPFALLCFTSFFTLTNPLGTMPVFLTMTHGMTDKERQSIVRRATIVSFITIMVFVFAGQFLFKFFGISTNGFRIAGGVIIFKIGFDMLQARYTPMKLKDEEIKTYADDISITPLGIPMLCGPGAIANAIVLMQDAHSYEMKGILIGTIALIYEGQPVIALCCNDAVMEKTMSNIVEVKARGAEVLAVAFKGNGKIVSLADDMIFVPKIDPLLCAVAEIVPLQLLAYYVAKENGCDIDKPKNLAKSVTVE